jgi:hypothetical protein
MDQYPFANTMGFQILLQSFVRSDVIFDVSHGHDLYNITTWQVNSQWEKTRMSLNCRYLADWCQRFTLFKFSSLPISAEQFYASKSARSHTFAVVPASIAGVTRRVL